MNDPFGGTAALEQPQRQSGWAVLFLAVRTVRAVGVVQLVIGLGFVLAQSPPLLLLLTLIPLVGLLILGIAALSWWRYTFAVVDDELLVTKGILSQERLVVPLERIQSVSIEQKLLHRPIGLVQVSVDTAGTAEAEFTIDAIDRTTATALQQVAADHRALRASRVAAASESDLEDGSRAARTEDVVVLRHNASRLVKLALTQMPLAGLAVLAPIFAVGDELVGALPFDTPNFDGPGVGLWLFWAIPLGIAATIGFLVLINLVRVVVSEWNLTLTATASGLRRDAGLLATTSKASSIPRIQRMATGQGVLERLVDLYTVSLNTVGSGSILLPGCDGTQVAAIRGRVFDEAEIIRDPSRRVSSTQTFKDVRNTSIFCVLLFAGLVAFASWWSLAVFLFVPLVWATSRRSVRLRRWGLSNDSITDRQELFGWTRQELLLRKVNGVAVRQSLFERSRNLATVTLQTAEGTISIGMVSLEEARAVRDRALLSAETDPRAWM